MHAATPMNTPCNSNTTALKYGAGQLNPAKAQDPGLVYDTLEGDYVAMLRSSRSSLAPTPRPAPTARRPGHPATSTTRLWRPVWSRG